jgi:hypothetical protein
LPGGLIFDFRGPYSLPRLDRQIIFSMPQDRLWMSAFVENHNAARPVATKKRRTQTYSFLIDIF